jgi:hypothetical protein
MPRMRGGNEEDSQYVRRVRWGMLMVDSIITERSVLIYQSRILNV